MRTLPAQGTNKANRTTYILPVDDVLAVQKPQRQAQLHDVKANVQHIGEDLGMFLQRHRRAVVASTNGIQTMRLKQQKEKKATIKRTTRRLNRSPPDTNSKMKYAWS